MASQKYKTYLDLIEKLISVGEMTLYSICEADYTPEQP